MSGFTEATAPDGRALEVLTGGAEDGYPLLFHGGTPSAAAPYDRLDEAFVEAGLRLVTYSRPGYGGSTPRDIGEGQPRIADDVPDSLSVLDHLGIDQFITLGWSGGGPRALACAALAPERCRAAATLAGVAPYNAEGLDWLAGMGPENVEDFGMAVRGPEVYEAFLEETIPPLFEATPDQLVESFGGLVTPVDAAFITGDFADYISRVFGRAGAQGVIGVRDDGLAIWRRGASASTTSRSRSRCGRDGRTRWCPSATASGWRSTSRAPPRTCSRRRATCRCSRGSRRSSPISRRSPASDSDQAATTYDR
jgi:pimeloyl-ACP methyl ester carboxylesterase